MIFFRVEALICALSLVVLSGAHRAIRPRALPSSQTATSDALQPARTNTSSISTRATYVPDHRDWEYLNGIPWWKTDATQQDHLRFHAYLSMAAYGDYAALCPSTFPKGFTVLENFNTEDGQAGFTALIPDMDKVVIVFRGYEDYRALDWSEASIEDLVTHCQGCTVAAGVKKLYLSAKAATNNWQVAKKAVAAHCVVLDPSQPDKKKCIKFSVTGHAMGGAVAALAAMDLGATGDVHYSHNQAMARVFNYASVVRYDNLFQALAGQSIVAKDDYMVQIIPLGKFSHVGTKVVILGEMQQWLINCYGNNENSTCLGTGNNYAIHDNYFTPKGQCGTAHKAW
ncbi:hypothetical protein PtA15_11A600 [Puccinia triticina]|uniref:Fungal lipase-type domain-containing protein n=1 Tax=Puccinia triticina TaxID=208348 RepID=A0ABY7CZZ1_9BASI|nr:uncharacterized protein PtA15_11A600 [Puccinia triticina]WAQ89908.1 hypothetical protein PtA15_11A600 [Puccinia triticina]WAR59954.1 hypothetical protein PtB15_11B595 [Puccinia triticina]